MNLVSRMVFSPHGLTCRVRKSSFFVSLGVLILGLNVAKVQAYVQEGPSWASGSTVTFQFALGSAGRTLADGNTSWDSAAMPAPTAWNANMGRMQFVSVVNASAPLSSGDGINTIKFSNSIFGQSFGSGTLA